MGMIYSIVALIAFILYYIYDVNSITINHPFIARFFIIGSTILLLDNIAIIYHFHQAISFDIFFYLYLLGTIVFFGLLIYTLFFALPFNETYLESDAQVKVVKTGVYALSRHIGVFWFCLMYLCLSLMFNQRDYTIFALVSCFLNFVYIVIQDKYIFIKTFADYREYQQEVPFLIPNYHSIKKALLKRSSI